MPELKVCFLDAGQGDCTLVEFPDAAQTTWLIDCGSIKNGAVVSGQIATVLARELPPRGNVIQRLILTHPDQDHYNLLSTIFGAGSPYTIQQIVYGGDRSQYENQKDHNFTYDLLGGANTISPNVKVNWNPQNIGGVQVTCLAANVSQGTADTNNCSIVLMLSYLGYNFFLMADAEQQTEFFILSQWSPAVFQAPVGSLLKMGHHGSNTSSTQPWVQAVRPSALIVSSDTRGFGSNASSIPRYSTIANAIAWSANVADLPATLNHTYVVWCDVVGSPFFSMPMMLGPTQQAVCTTLYNLQYSPSLQTFVSTGGSWYVSVSAADGVVVEFTGV